MKHIQESYITGFVTVSVTGKQPELFFQQCIERGIFVWNIKKPAENICKGNIRLHDIQMIKKLRRGTSYKIKFTQKKGLPFLVKRILKYKEILYALILSICLIVFLSNILWKVSITGVSEEMEEKINEQLITYGIRPGSLLFSFDSPAIIQQQLLNDLPELLWVGIDQKGTTFLIEGVEKVIVEKEEIKGPQNLVATKKGVIKSMFVTEGMPNVSVNDYVEQGDILVTGIIGQDETNEEKSKDKQKKLVAADGIVRAQTWYEISVTIPLTLSREQLTGNQENKYLVRLGRLQLPIWGFKKPNFHQVHEENHENRLKFMKWDLPISIIKSTLSEKVYNNIERTEEEAIKVGIDQAKQDLTLQLGLDARILSEKVLHHSLDNGKVKLNLFFSVEEDITKSEPITQGD